MTTHTIRKGFDIKIAGPAEAKIESCPEPVLVGLQPAEFLGIRPKLLVKEGQEVATGEPVLLDKSRPGVQLVAPATGRVTKVVLGQRRFPDRIEITPAAEDRFFDGPRLDADRLDGTSRDEVIEALEGAGLWPYLRQRPLGKIAAKDRVPTAIYVNGMDTEPLAADPAVAVQGRGEALQAGIRLLRRLTDGPVYLTTATGEQPAEFRGLQGVEQHQFSGPHPAGLVGTHIAQIAPLGPDQVVWYLKAQEAATLGEWVISGRYPTHRVVAVAGSAAPQRRYCKVRQGAALLTLTGGQPLGGDLRVINGTVLSGVASDAMGVLGFYAQTVSIIPEGSDSRELFGWARPQFGRLSASRAVFSWLMPKDRYELDARLNGGPRHIVNIGQWERMTPLDIHPTFLVRAVQAGDLEEAINLGLLEVTEEDVALCTFADPCKIEVGQIIREGLDLYETEG
ncbi:MAG: Na(+)-translocating NADH-quinone reductase subunit A [Planctomycetota bacterium]